MFFDSHAHLDDEKYNSDRDEMLLRAQKAGVTRIINVGYDIASSERSVDLAEAHNFIHAAVGIHPHDAADAGDNALDRIRELARHPKVVAIGEIGLDYYRDLSPREIQQKMFRSQIRLAAELGKPIIVHDRDAHGDVMAVLREENANEIGGVLHCFSGSMEMARECLKMGFYISIAGPVTFNNASKLQEVAAQVPLDRLLIETDSPYLTPEPYRGKRNESAFVVKVAEKIAALKNIPVEELARAATDNTKRAFGVND